MPDNNTPQSAQDKSSSLETKKPSFFESWWAENKLGIEKLFIEQHSPLEALSKAFSAGIDYGDAKIRSQWNEQAEEEFKKEAALRARIDSLELELATAQATIKAMSGLGVRQFAIQSDDAGVVLSCRDSFESHGFIACYTDNGKTYDYNPTSGTWDERK